MSLRPAELDAGRYADDNLSFWVPLLVERGSIRRDHRMLDVGCGTGGFAIAIAIRTGARVTGCDRAAALVDYARARSGEVRWLVADAQALPFRDGAFDLALMSLLLHQVACPRRAIDEAFRVLARRGRLVVRTVAPEDAANRVPFRFFPALAEAKAARMPAVDELAGWLAAAGFERVERARVVREKRLRRDEVEARFRAEAGRHPFLDAAAIEEGVARMRAEPETLVDPRPVHFVVGERPAGAGRRGRTSR